MSNVIPDIRAQRSATHVDRSIAARAAEQHGLITRAQLRQIGLSQSAIDHRVAAGRLHRVRRGVYSVGHAITTQPAKRLASALTYGDDAAVSHRAAESHWHLQQSTAIEVTVPRRVRPRDTIRTHCLPLPPDEVTLRDGIPVTIVPRTIFDLGIYGHRAVERALHEAEHRRYADPLTLADIVARYPHRKGAAVVRAVLAAFDETDGLTESGLEELFLSFLRARNLPVGRMNAWIALEDRVIRGDHVYERERVIVELDGGTHRTPLGRRSDDRRDVAAQTVGWRVIRVSKYALLQEPDGVEADLRRLLASQAR